MVNARANLTNTVRYGPIFRITLVKLPGVQKSITYFSYFEGQVG
jgi:hypothetical protein